MPSWSEILKEVNASSQESMVLQDLRNKYLNKIAQLTNRNVIAYYSGWMKKADAPHCCIDDSDMNAFMNAIHGMDKTKGLDLILHTPGGDLAATESIVNYLKKMFNNDIRAIVPQLSMSAGTLIAMSCKSIVMGKQSSLGPIDPQLGGVACQAVVDEFIRAVSEVSKNSSSLGIWQTIISKYHPTFLATCEKSIEWSKKLSEVWLHANNAQLDVGAVQDLFLNHKNSYSHSRHIPKDDCRAVGLNIEDLEQDQDFQDAVLSLHHCYMILFDKFLISKIVESQTGKCFVQQYSN